MLFNIKSLTKQPKFHVFLHAQSSGTSSRVTLASLVRDHRATKRAPSVLMAPLLTAQQQNIPNSRDFLQTVQFLLIAVELPLHFTHPHCPWAGSPQQRAEGREHSSSCIPTTKHSITERFGLDCSTKLCARSRHTI